MALLMNHFGQVLPKQQAHEGLSYLSVRMHSLFDGRNMIQRV